MQHEVQPQVNLFDKAVNVTVRLLSGGQFGVQRTEAYRAYDQAHPDYHNLLQRAQNATSLVAIDDDGLQIIPRFEFTP